MDHLLSYHEAAAHAAAVSSVEAVPVFPELIAARVFGALRRLHQSDYVDVASQQAMLSYAMASTIAEKRSFLATANITAPDEAHRASFMRLPLVCVNFSRALGTFSIRTDQSGAFAMRDAGWLLSFVETQQELLDSVIMSYRVSEDSKVMLPSLINVDGIANMREPVSVMNKKIADNLLPRLRMPRKLRDNGTFGPPVAEEYHEFREQQQLAMKNAAGVFRKAAEKWKEKFKRIYGFVEKFHVDDADFVIVMAGFYSSTCKSFVLKARQQGEKVGLLRVRVARPWPEQEIADALKNAKKVAVIDRGASLGATGFMHNEIRPLHSFCSSFISYKPLSEKDFADVLAKLKKQEKPESVWF